MPAPPLASTQSIFQFFVEGGCFAVLLACSAADAPAQNPKPVRSDLKRDKSAKEAMLRSPLAAYNKQVVEVIGKRWNDNVRKHRDLYAIGKVELAFRIDRAGRVRDLRVVSNTSNKSFLLMCEGSVRKARIPPPSRTVIEAAKNEMLEIPFTFTLY